MTLIKKSLMGAVAAIAMMAAGSQAHAFTITIGGAAAGDGSGLTTAQAGASVIDFNGIAAGTTGAFSTGGVNFSGNGAVENGSSSGQFAAPDGDTTNYLVAGGPTAFTGSENLAITGPSSNYFGLYWGSMDAYNTLTFLNGGSVVATITGSDVAAGGNANGGQAGLGTNNYVNIFNLPQYDSVVLTTTQANFEVDNIAFGQVPEPATLALFGAGLLGLGALRRRKQS